jgi:DNA modification methylase
LTRVEEFGDAKLILGDCREVLEIKPHGVDFIFCDPPSGYSNSDGDVISIRKPALGLAKEGEVYASRPIANDDPEEAKALIEWLINEATKSLVKGGCICCCCSGGGGKDVALADWTQMMVAVPHLEFKQVIVWDKGPMGWVGTSDVPTKSSWMPSAKVLPVNGMMKQKRLKTSFAPGTMASTRLFPAPTQIVEETGQQCQLTLTAPS